MIEKSQVGYDLFLLVFYSLPGGISSLPIGGITGASSMS